MAASNKRAAGIQAKSGEDAPNLERVQVSMTPKMIGRLDTMAQMLGRSRSSAANSILEMVLDDLPMLRDLLTRSTNDLLQRMAEQDQGLKAQLLSEEQRRNEAAVAERRKAEEEHRKSNQAAYERATGEREAWE